MSELLIEKLIEERSNLSNPIIIKASALIKECEESGRPIVIGIFDHDVVDPETNEPSLSSSFFMSVRCNAESATKILEALSKLKDDNAAYWEAMKKKEGG